jgi:hypothetical protein
MPPRRVRAVGAHRGIAVDPEAPRMDSALTCHPGARPTEYLIRTDGSAGKQTEGSVGTAAEISAVEVSVHVQGSGQTGRALGQFLVISGRKTTFPSEFPAFCDLSCTEQNSARPALGATHHVHAVPHAVGEVDVRMSGGTEHHIVTGCAPAVGVRAGIALARVGLDFRKTEPDRTVRSGAYQRATQEIPCHIENGAVEELPAEGLTGDGRDHGAERSARWMCEGTAHGFPGCQDEARNRTRAPRVPE